MFSENEEEVDEGREMPERSKETLELDADQKALIRKRISVWIEEVSQTRLEFAFNLSSVLMNARNARHELKGQALAAILHKSREFGHVLNRFFSVVFPERKDLAFQAGWSALYSALHIADRMVGDPFLINVLREIKKATTSREEKLQLLDLLLCCGDDVHDEILQALKEAKRLDITFAVYVRIVGIYYFRYHQNVDRSMMRKLLKDIRLADKSHLLPKILLYGVAMGCVTLTLRSVSAV